MYKIVVKKTILVAIFLFLAIFQLAAAIQIKKNALECHKTQLRLRDNFLQSFIRVEEIFWKN